jgi:hypothetical protein
MYKVDEKGPFEHHAPGTGTVRPKVATDHRFFGPARRQVAEHHVSAIEWRPPRSRVGQHSHGDRPVAVDVRQHHPAVGLELSRGASRVCFLGRPYPRGRGIRQGAWECQGWCV